MDKQEIDIDLNKLMAKVYNKIALWNNEDGTPVQKKEHLKFVSHEIIELVLSEVMENINVKTRVTTIPSTELIQNKESFWDKLFKK